MNTICEVAIRRLVNTVIEEEGAVFVRRRHHIKVFSISIYVFLFVDNSINNLSNV